jgi:proteic killer suppression protein
MLITFRNKKLQKCCSVEKEAIKTYGEKRARKLMQRLMELRAAENLSYIPRTPPPRCHELTGNLKGILSVDLEHPWRLLFIPAHNPVPMMKHGGLDWTQVTAVRITAIEDTH